MFYKIINHTENLIYRAITTFNIIKNKDSF